MDDCDCDYILPRSSVSQPHYDNCRTVLGEKTQLYRNEDGSIRLQNQHLNDLQTDILYHLGLDTEKYHLKAMFGDVKFVCMGGTKHRMRELAEYLRIILGENNAEELRNITKHSHRYAMYKVGPVLSVSHGIGIPSMTILLQEIIKLLHYSGAKHPLLFRVGTSGGVDVAPGSVVVSGECFNGELQEEYCTPILGKLHKFPAQLDSRVSEELESLGSRDDGFQTVIGGTMAADDFYRGQARLDGPFCHHTEQDKMAFLRKLQSRGIKNIEMEATAFAALTKEAGLRAADVCVTLVDRLKGDQVTPSKATLIEWQKRPMIIIGRYIAEYCNKIKNNQ